MKKKKKLESRYVMEVLGSLVISLFLAYRGNLYWQLNYGNTSSSFGTITTSSEQGSILGCILGSFMDETWKWVAINPRIFWGGFFIVLGICAVSCLIIELTVSQNKAMRVGHEHGKAKLAVKSDYEAFRKKFTDEGNYNILFSENVALSMDNRKTNRTTNVLVIGGTGTGKTFRYIKPNLAQLNSSKIITDPSGDLFKSFAPFLISQGKNVYLFNVSDMSMSNHFNPLLNVYGPDGNIDSQKVDVLVDLYMDNASEGNAQGGSDPFWPKSEKAFLTGVIYYVLENDAIPKVEKCFNTVLKYVQKAKLEQGQKETTLTKEIKAWQKEMEQEGRKIYTPLYYDTFLIAPEKTANTILITTAVDLQIFSNEHVDRITRWNAKYPDMNINIDDIAQTETYLFLGIPQGHAAYNFLIAMLYSQIYTRLYDLGEKILNGKYLLEEKKGFPLVNPFDSKEQAKQFQEEVSENCITPLPYVNGTDIYYLQWHNITWKKSFSEESLKELIQRIKKAKIRQNKTSPELPMSVQFMLDEFKNIGEIPNFLTIISTSRKYRIGSHVVIQDIAQLKELYPDDSHQTVIANVDTTLFLGSNLPEDKEYIQKALGKTTILQKSDSGSRSGRSTSYTPTEVDLMSIDEIGAINQGGRNDAIVIIRDLKPFVDRKLNYLEHPNFKTIAAMEDKIDAKEYYINNRLSAI